MAIRAPDRAKNGSTVLKEFDITVFLLSGIFYANRVI